MRLSKALLPLEAFALATALAWPPNVMPAAGGATEGLGRGFRVRIARPALASAVNDALDGASRRLRGRQCGAIFTDFADAGGSNLQSNLERMGRTGEDYLALIAFHDGQGMGQCQRTGIMAVTVPGSRVVWVCDGFALAQKRDRGLAEVALLHEALHTLGLRENPPSSLEITARVVKRCGR